MTSYSDFVIPTELEPVKLVIPKKDSNEKENDYTETEKMVAGLPYFAMTKDLMQGRLFAKLTCRKLNNADLIHIEERNTLLKELLGTCGENVYIEPPFFCDYGSNIHCAKGVYMNHNCLILDVCEVIIGERTLFAPGVQVYTATHPTCPVKRRTTEYGKPIKIGKDCWIGGNAIICPGVTIGDGVTIGAGSVVTKDIESFSVAVGNPARVIKKLDKPENFDIV